MFVDERYNIRVHSLRWVQDNTTKRTVLQFREAYEKREPGGHLMTTISEWQNIPLVVDDAAWSDAAKQLQERVK